MSQAVSLSLSLCNDATQAVQKKATQHAVDRHAHRGVGGHCERREGEREARAHSAMSLSTLNPHIVHEQGCGWQGKGESLGSVAMQHKSAELGKDSYE